MKEKFKDIYEKFNSHKIRNFILSVFILLIVTLPFIFVFTLDYLEKINLPFFERISLLNGSLIFFILPYLIPIILIITTLLYKDYYILKILLFLTYFLSIFFQLVSTMGIYTDEDFKFFLYRYVIPNIIFVIIFALAMFFKFKALENNPDNIEEDNISNDDNNKSTAEENIEIDDNKNNNAKQE